jgi:nifR3 family TIM-barrel protein
MSTSTGAVSQAHEGTSGSRVASVPSVLRIGPLELDAPVVLAPMAGVTNAAFRSMCRRHAPGLVYVNEMVMATALVQGNPRTAAMVSFDPDERPRSLQLYGSDPDIMGRAVRALCDGPAGRQVDHIDINFGCPAPKVTRRGGGAAVPARPRLLAAIVRAAVEAAAPHGVPVTIKFRMGISDTLLTHIATGRIAQEEGAAAVALHARTAEQHYAGEARWEAIAELKSAVTEIPVLGNGDIWEAADAREMMRRTGCDGVVVGRGCLGRPWLFADLVRVLGGGEAAPAPLLGGACSEMLDHLRELVTRVGESQATRDFRKHTSWYLTGYPVGGDVRRRCSQISSVAELEDIVGELDPDVEIVPGGERIRRGHTNGPIRVVLPEGHLDDVDDLTPPDEAGISAMSGG